MRGWYTVKAKRRNMANLVQDSSQVALVLVRAVLLAVVLLLAR